MKKIKALILKPVVMIRPAMPVMGMKPVMPMRPAAPVKAVKTVTPVRAAKSVKTMKPANTAKPVKAKAEPCVDALDKPHRVPGKPNHYIYK